MTVKLGQTSEDAMEDHSMLTCVFKNRSAVKENREKDGVDCQLSMNSVSVSQ